MLKPCWLVAASPARASIFIFISLATAAITEFTLPSEYLLCISLSAVCFLAFNFSIPSFSSFMAFCASSLELFRADLVVSIVLWASNEFCFSSFSKILLKSPFESIYDYRA